MVELTALVADLTAEGAEVDALVADLDADGWATPTPCPGWTIAHQIAHLAWTDERTLLAVNDPTAFQDELATVLATTPADQLDTIVDQAAADGARLPPADLLAGWRRGRTELATAITRHPAGTRIPWYGPPMTPTSMATARLMETWAHTNDVADALGVTRTPTARLRHVAHISVRARDWAFTVRRLPPPTEPFRVELTAPDGDRWTWGPEDAAQRVTGPALDFCLLATQRIHRADTDLTATGPDADRWLDIAQAFAGPPGEGRAPR